MTSPRSKRNLEDKSLREKLVGIETLEYADIENHTNKEFMTKEYVQSFLDGVEDQYDQETRSEAEEMLEDSDFDQLYDLLELE